MAFKFGDHLVIDDRTGRKVLASKTVKEWSGGVVDRAHAIDLYRHPQEIQRVVKEKQSVNNPRPRPPDVFIGPVQAITIEAAPAGTVFLRLASLERFQPGDRIGVLLGNLDLWLTTVRQIYSTYIDAGFGALSEFAFSEDYAATVIANRIELAFPLPWGVDSGALVVDYTSTIRPDVIDESLPTPNYAPSSAPHA